MFWKNKEKIKQEKLEKLYKEVDEYFRKVFYNNFVPNMNVFKVAYHSGDEDFRKNFSTFFADFNKVDLYSELMKKLYDDEVSLPKPISLLDYIQFFNGKKLTYCVKKLKSYDMIKLDGTQFNVSSDEVLYICNNIVGWKDDSTELIQKIIPNYSYENKELVWSWDDTISIEDIQSHYIDFKTEEEEILKGEK